MTTDKVVQRYHDRMQRVLDHIDRYADGDLDLTTLSAIAAFSKYHFHRQFSSIFGIAIGRYVQLVRLKRASYRLAFRSVAFCLEAYFRDRRSGTFGFHEGTLPPP